MKNSIWHRVNAQSRNASYHYHPPEMVFTSIICTGCRISHRFIIYVTLPCCQTFRLLAGGWFVY